MWQKIKDNPSKFIIAILIGIGVLGFVHTVKKHPENNKLGLITFYRGIEIFFHSREDVSFKVSDCRKISSADFEEQVNWEAAPERHQDSIIAYGEDYFKLYFEKNRYTGYTVVKKEPLVGRMSGAEGFTYFCKGTDGRDVEIIFEKNNITNTIKMVFFEKEYVYEYTVSPI